MSVTPMQFLHLYPRICHDDSRLGSAEERIGMRLVYCRDERGGGGSSEKGGGPLLVSS